MNSATRGRIETVKVKLVSYHSDVSGSCLVLSSLMMLAAFEITGFPEPDQFFIFFLIEDAVLQ